MLDGCDRNTKPAISTNVKDWEMFQMMNHISNSRVTGIENFLLMFSIFIYINTASATHTPPPAKKREKKRKRSSAPEQEHTVPKVGGKSSFFITVLHKGSNQLSAFISLLAEFIELRNCHGNRKMEAMIYYVLVKTFAGSCYSQSHAPFR